MIQEYLINDDAEKDSIISHDFEQKEEIKDALKIGRRVDKITNADAWIISYTVKSNGEEAAKILSDVDKWICNNSNAIILSNESSAYFNKTLFPIINDFERSLRKLLYLMSAKHKNEDSSQNIKNLEEQDLGKLFELLFADSDFNKKVKQLVNNKSWNFTKSEILNDVNEIDEVTVWNQLVGNEMVSSLRQNYIAIKDDRNHVMHAHNIDYSTYSSIKKLFKKVNAEIDDAINDVLGKRSLESPEFNEFLSAALKTFTEAMDETGIKETVSSIMIPAMKLLSDNMAAISSTLYSDSIRVAIENISENAAHLNLDMGKKNGKDQDGKDNDGDLKD